MQQGSTSSHGCAGSFYFAQNFAANCRPSPEALLLPRPSRARRPQLGPRCSARPGNQRAGNQARGPQPRGIIGGSPEGPREREACGETQHNAQRASEKPAGSQRKHHHRTHRPGTARNHLPIDIGATHRQAQLIRGPAEEENPDHEPGKERQHPGAHRVELLPPVTTRRRAPPVLPLTALNKPGCEQLQTKGKWPETDLHHQRSEHEVDD